MVSAYIALAGNTYNQTFHSLDEIRQYVVKKEKNDNDK
jgi:muramidase (phage lysozyme)